MPWAGTAVGVRGIRLRRGRLCGAAPPGPRPGKTVLSITERGYGKRTPVEEYRITSRGGLGIRNYMVTEKTGPIVGIKVVDGQEDLLLMTQAGILIRTAVDSIRIAGRATQGVIVMRFKEEGDHVISMALGGPGGGEARPGRGISHGEEKGAGPPRTRWRYLTKTLYHDPSATGEFTYDGVVYRKSEALQAVESRNSRLQMGLVGLMFLAFVLATYFRSAMPLAAGILLIVAGQVLRLSRLPKDILSHLTDTGRREL